MPMKIGSPVKFTTPDRATYHALVCGVLDDDTISLVYVQTDGRIENHSGVRLKGAPERRYEMTEAEMEKHSRLVDDGREHDAEEFLAFIQRPMGSAAGVWEP